MIWKVHHVIEIQRQHVHDGGGQQVLEGDSQIKGSHVQQMVIWNIDDQLIKIVFIRYVSYEEYPRNESAYPGNSTEHYPDYIVGWMLVVTPGTSANIVQAAKVVFNDNDNNT